MKTAAMVEAEVRETAGRATGTARTAATILTSAGTAGNCTAATLVWLCFGLMWLQHARRFVGGSRVKRRCLDEGVSNTPRLVSCQICKWVAQASDSHMV
jgi:hypothetical protein